MTRTELMDARNREYNDPTPDFAYATCPSCGNDTVAEYGDKYPTAVITGCNKCHRSWCD